MKLDLAAIRERANCDRELALTAKHWRGTVVLEFGDDPVTVVFDRGAIGVRQGSAEPHDLRISAPESKWEAILAATPPPHAQDVLAASRMDPEVTIDGDRMNHLFPFYAALQRFVGVVREVRNGDRAAAPAVDLAPVSDRTFDSAVGRYVYLTIDAVQYRVYHEEAGTGIPILCHHTAGADGRQFRHFLEDRDFQQKFRMIAYDLPYHGRSVPPAGKQWWTEEYRLTFDFLRKFVVAFSHALELDRPVFLGSSIGGVLAPDLAYSEPDEFRAVIGVNSGIYFGAVKSNPEMLESYRHPKVNSVWAAADARGAMAPTAPEALRREAGWISSQAGPGVYVGDLHYYQAEHDLRDKLRDIDTTRCAVYILAGEYDPSTRAKLGSKAVADGIAGATYAVVPGGGHYLVSENPEQFKAAIAPILDEIASRSLTPA